MRRRYVWVDAPPGANYRGWVPIEDVRPARRLQIVRDEHEPFRSHVTGKIHDSKSAYRRELRDHGMIELGNDRVEPQPFRPAKGVDEALARALADRGL